MKKHMNEDFCQAVIQRALSASKIAIITHMNPDGDGICSARAVQVLLRTFGKDSCLFNEFGCPENLRFLLENTPVFTENEPGAEGYDLVLTIDCGSEDRAGRVGWLLKQAEYVINIDHHATNTQFGDLNYVDADAAATGLLVYDMYQVLGVEITKEVAELLYAAISTDTGNFSYSNTDKRVHTVIGDLIERGADVAKLSFKLFRESTWNRLQLTREVLSTARTYSDGKIATMCVTAKMMKETGTDSSDTEDCINYIRDIAGVQVAVVLKETENEGTIKVSFRSNVAIDVGKIAQEFGGGGHYAAAGCSIQASIEEAEEAVVARVQRALL